MLTSEALAEALPAFLQRQRWFGEKDQPIRAARLTDVATLPDRRFYLCLLEASLATGRETYLLPLAFTTEPDEKARHAGIAWIEGADARLLLHDAAGEPAFWEALFRQWQSGASLPASGGAFHFEPDATVQQTTLEAAQTLSGEQSNASALWGARFFAKLYRRLEPGVHPEPERLRHLMAVGFSAAAALHGTLTFRRSEQTFALGILQDALPGAENGWTVVLEALRARLHDNPVVLEAMHALGQQTATLHAALARATAPAMRPQSASAADLHALTQRIAASLTQTRALLDQHPDLTRQLTREDWQRGLEKLNRLALLSPTASRIRVHGDYHLGQVVRSGGKWYILDFEGEPDRALDKRRQPDSALRDVAGMVRSVEYALLFAAGEATNLPAASVTETYTSAFLNAYFATAGKAPFLPSAATCPLLLWAYLLDKALYEVRYELGHRPNWAWIPLHGLRRLLNA